MILGNLRYKIEVLAPAIVKNIYGEAEETFTNFLTLKADRKEVSGNKNIDNSEIFNITRIDWTIHYRQAITEKMRIKYNNKQYKILYIQEVGFKECQILQTELINE